MVYKQHPGANKDKSERYLHDNLEKQVFFRTLHMNLNESNHKENTKVTEGQMNLDPGSAIIGFSSFFLAASPPRKRKF